MLSLAGVGVCWSIYNPKMTVYTRELVFWQDALVGLSQKLATLLASVAVAYVFRSYWAIVAGQAAAAATLVVMSYAFMPFRPRFPVPRRAADVLLLGLAVARLARGSLNARVDPLFIGYVSGNTALGHYSVGDNLAALPTREVLSPLSSTLFPGFTKVADDPDGLRAAFLRAQSLLSVLSFPAASGWR
jgi:PST family polysaccharide transporter